MAFLCYILSLLLNRTFMKKLMISMLGLYMAAINFTPALAADYSDYPIFDHCGTIAHYQDQDWYSDLESKASDAKLNLGSFKEGCYSENASIFVFMKPGSDCKMGDFYRFDRDENKLEKATVKTGDEDCVTSPAHFGKNVGHYVIKLVGARNEDGCKVRDYYDYNFKNNVVEFKKVTTSCD